MTPLVTTEWLAAELGKSDLRVIDATAGTEGGARAAFEAGHIPGAVFFDLDEIVDTTSDIPNMLPPAEKFASRMQALGLGDGSRIVVYDNSPLHSSARAWWMLTLFGAHEVSILDGGLAKWQAESRETKTGKESLRHRHFTVFKDEGAVRTLEQMRGLVGGHGDVGRHAPALPVPVGVGIVGAAHRDESREAVTHVHEAAIVAGAARGRPGLFDPGGRRRSA